MATNMPRFLAGETSATYMGDSTEAAPTAKPPNKRDAIKRVDDVAMAVTEHETAKKSATMIRMLLRPYLSVSTPEPKAPIMAPTNSELTPQPNCSSFHPK